MTNRGTPTPVATTLLPREAVETMLRHVWPRKPVQVPLMSALGRILAHEVASPIDLPAWDNSGMDGYALQAEDVEGKIPVELDVIEEIAAGAFPTLRVRAGTCARIFTGAPVPDGADTVIRQEDTEAQGAERVVIRSDRDVRRNVRPRGEDLRVGDIAVRAGTELMPAHLGVLASIAAPTVSVYGTPTVAVIATGDEIADLDEREAILAGRKIASSNSYTIRSMIAEAGAECMYLGIAPDDPNELRARIQAAADADLLITSAGVSVGDHDYLRPVLQSLGATLEFWRIRMRPGAPVGFGLLGDVPWVGLPGNPVSTMVTFELFVRPVIRKMRGHTALFRRTVPVTAGEPITTHAALRHFLRVLVSQEGEGPVARVAGPQGSGILTSMTRANALLIVPEDRQEIPAGERVSALMFGDPIHVTDAPY